MFEMATLIADSMMSTDSNDETSSFFQLPSSMEDVNQSLVNIYELNNTNINDTLATINNSLLNNSIQISMFPTLITTLDRK
jgi:hypothetical protein